MSRSILAGAATRLGPVAGTRPAALRLGLAGVAACAAAALAGCTQSLAVAALQPNPVRTAIDRGDMRSPKAAAVALTSLEGAPDDVLARFRTGVAQEAGARDVTISDPAQAHYFVRGYLDAFPTEDGTSLHFVWDVFDAGKRRVERLEDGLDLPRSDGNPWSLVDDKVVSSMAARSADAIATYLATTPEAQAAQAPPSGAAPAAAAAAAVKSIGPVNSSENKRPTL